MIRSISIRALLITALVSNAAFLHSQTTEAEADAFASERLLTIAKKEEKIYQRLAEDPNFYSNEDLERRVRELAHSYSTYLSDHPNDPEAYILYGKLLRRMGRGNEAFTAFLQADKLDPNVAVVKQQIGTYLAEAGKAKAALLYYQQAVELEPTVALYHFGLGELLLNFGQDYIDTGIYTRDAIDREMLKCFKTAATLAPENFDYQMRLGEAYYDQASPEWKAALVHWSNLRREAQTGLQMEIIDLHRARVMGKLGRYEEAKELAGTVQNPALQMSKQQVLDEVSQY